MGEFLEMNENIWKPSGRIVLTQGSLGVFNEEIGIFKTRCILRIEEHMEHYWRIYYHHHFEPRRLQQVLKMAVEDQWKQDLLSKPRIEFIFFPLG